MPDNLFSPEKMKEQIAKDIFESRTYYKKRFDMADEYIKRYEAKRSISGLMGWGDDPRANPKNEPWRGSSDVGIPIEAFTIEGLLPRFLKVCYGAKPIVWIKGQSEDDYGQAGEVQDALNFQLTKKIKIYRRMKLCFKNVVMSGDGIAKCVWEEENKIINRVVYFIADANTNEPILDEAGNPTEVGNNDEVPPLNPTTGVSQIKIKKILSEPKKIYDGPKVYSRNIKQIVIPKDADTADINELDWICDQYERTLDWVKKNIGNPEEGKFDEQVVIELEQDIINKTLGPEKESHLSQKVLISEWHGGYDVNDDGLKEEIVVFIASKDLNMTSNSLKDIRLLGWMITPYPQRPFFHYQIIPRDGSFYGMGIPEFLIGIRNLIDAIFNQMIDRGSIHNNPPITGPSNHDPDENPFGPGAFWPNDSGIPYRVLELPKSEQIEFTKIEFLLALVQKLFGVTDFTPPPSVENQRTATGIMSVISEGNIKFDDMIRALQDINEDLYDFIVQLNADFLDDEFIYLIADSENPFRKIIKQRWAGNFDYEAVGNSININREIEQNRAMLAYNTSLNSFGKNPAITPEVMVTVTENWFRAIDMRNVKIPTIEDLQKQRIHEMAQAILLTEQMKAQQAQGVQNGTIPTAGSPEARPQVAGLQ